MTQSDTNSWDLPDPFVFDVSARAEDQDVFGHVNNARYLQWLDAASWAHWEAGGYDSEECRRDDRGMAVIRTEADYLKPAYAGDQLQVGVWITASDQRLRAERRFQICRASTGETLFRARWKLVCFALDTGRPARMTAPFIDHYSVMPQVRAALERQEPHLP